MACVMTKKPHDLKEIDRHSSGFPGIFRVVRWCCNCGSVVIDNDIDGKVAPGDWKAMQFPRIALDKAEQMKPKEEK
jgi:hypothetical protein